MIESLWHGFWDRLPAAIMGDELRDTIDVLLVLTSVALFTLAWLDRRRFLAHPARWYLKAGAPPRSDEGYLAAVRRAAKRRRDEELFRRNRAKWYRRAKLRAPEVDETYEAACRRRVETTAS